MSIIAGFATALGLLVAMFLVVYPFVYTTVKGLFETSDLGAVLGLLACFAITGPVIVLGSLLVAFVAYFVGEVQRRKRNERYRKLSRR